jgi:uncharacterized coiled-coil protein SlyX
MKKKKNPALKKVLAELQNDIIEKKKEVHKTQKQLSEAINKKRSLDEIFNLKKALTKAQHRKGKASLSFRYHHVAHSELNGKIRKEIEKNYRENTEKLDEKKITKLKKAFFVPVSTATDSENKVCPPRGNLV